MCFSSPRRSFSTFSYRFQLKDSRFPKGKSQVAVPSKNQKSAMVKTSPTKGSQGDKNHKRYLDVDLVLHFEMTFIYSYIIIYIYIYIYR